MCEEGSSAYVAAKGDSECVHCDTRQPPAWRGVSGDQRCVGATQEHRQFATAWTFSALLVSMTTKASELAYDYDVTVLADTDGTYKAYWCATEGAPESEGVFYQQSNAPWNFFPPGQQYALRTTGVRIARLRNVDTNERWDRAMQFDVGIAANYQTDRTLGFLRRERHDASGATIELWECTIGADHFITAFKDYECAGLSAVKLGYAYTTGGPGLSPRYRCRNRGNGEHMTTTDPLCESDAFVLEGAVGNWRDGTMYTHPVDGTWEVSPFGDGAYLCPNSVIKDTDNIYYMAYTASPHYGNGGPFNQLFLATSVDGVTFRPIVDAAGLPRPLATYTSDYPNLLLAADAPPGRPAGQPATRDHIANAFGVGAGQLMKIGGAYRLYYMDSSRYIAASAPGCPNHIGDPGKPATNFRMVRRTASSWDRTGNRRRCTRRLTRVGRARRCAYGLRTGRDQDVRRRGLPDARAADPRRSEGPQR